MMSAGNVCHRCDCSCMDCLTHVVQLNHISDAFIYCSCMHVCIVTRSPEIDSAKMKRLEVLDMSQNEAISIALDLQ